MSPQLTQGLAAIGRSVDAGREITLSWSADLERELLDLCEDHDNSDLDLYGIHTFWCDVSGWRIRLVGCQSTTKTEAARAVPPPLRSPAEATTPGVVKHPGGPQGLLCHCGRCIPTTARPVGFYEIEQRLPGVLLTCVCNTTKTLPLPTITARGIVRRAWRAA